MVNRANGHRANGNRADVVAPLIMHPRSKLLVQINKAGWSVDNAPKKYINYSYKLIKQVGQLIMYTGGRLLVKTNKAGVGQLIMHLRGRLLIQTDKVGWSVNNAP